MNSENNQEAIKTDKNILNEEKNHGHLSSDELWGLFVRYEVRKDHRGKFRLSLY